LSQKTSRIEGGQRLTGRRVLKIWFPLVISWAIRSIEMPIITMVIARLANPEVNLAAYGGVSYPVAVVIEAPIVMLLAASTALSRDWDSYQKLKKISLIIGGVCMFVHVLVAATPLFDFVAGVLLAVPPNVIEPARWGLLFMAPWSLAIGYRRFEQGAMIRFNHPHMVNETSIVRIIIVGLVLFIGYSLETIPATVIAGAAQGFAVSVEALYAGWRARKFQHEIKQAPQAETPLTLKGFSTFYIPLLLTATLSLIWQPMVSGAVSRLPSPLESLAVWSIFGGLLFLFRSPGLAYNEVVVALLEKQDGYRVLKKFSLWSSIASTFVVSLLVFTPISKIWFGDISRLPETLVPIAITAIAMSVPITVFAIYISFYQGIVVYTGKTQPIAESFVIYLLSMGAVLILGIILQSFVGIYVAVIAVTLAHLAQAIWLGYRTRPHQRNLLHREQEVGNLDLTLQ
jgi:hypothetical protein